MRERYLDTLRERERERERRSERQTDNQTERDKLTDRRTDRSKDRQTGSPKEVHVDIPSDKKIARLTK